MALGILTKIGHILSKKAYSFAKAELTRVKGAMEAWLWQRGPKYFYINLSTIIVAQWTNPQLQSIRISN